MEGGLQARREGLQVGREGLQAGREGLQAGREGLQAGREGLRAGKEGLQLDLHSHPLVYPCRYWQECDRSSLGLCFLQVQQTASEVWVCALLRSLQQGHRCCARCVCPIPMIYSVQWWPKVTGRFQYGSHSVLPFS